MKKNFLSILLTLFIVGVPVATFLVELKNNERTVSSETLENSIDFDLSLVEKKDLIRAIKYQFLQKTFFDLQHDKYHLSFGHFQFLNSEKLSLGCDAYPKIKLQFIADGIAVSGDTPTFNIEYPCSYDGMLEIIDPVSIPLKYISEQHPTDNSTMQIEENVSIQFSNLTFDWPQHWMLNQIKLLSNESNKDIIIEGHEIHSVLKKGIRISYPEDNNQEISE